MICKITIRMDNAAFRDSDGKATDDAWEAELGRILRVLGKEVKDFGVPAWRGIADANGNQVGELVIEED